MSFSPTDALDDFTPPEIAQAVAGEDWRTRATFRAAARRSLYVYVKTLTCYNEIPNLFDPGVYRESCEWLQHVVEVDKRGLFEDPRGHIKSTRSTDSIPNWIAILAPDPAYDFPEEVTRARQYLVDHPHLRGVDSRIVVASDSKERATTFTGVSRDHWMVNPVLRWAFPERLWPNVNVRDGSLGWSEGSWTPRGRTNLLIRDDFMRAIGVESKEQGGRAEGIIADDLVGEQSWRSELEITRRIEWLGNVGNLLENSDYRARAGGFIIVVESRWSLNDVNTHIHVRLHDWSIWRRGAFRCVVHGTGNCGRWGLAVGDATPAVDAPTASDGTIEMVETVNPCALSDVPLWTMRYPNAESLERVRRDKGDEIFNAQWLNDPTQSAQLDPSKFRPFHIAVEIVRDVETGAHRRAWCVVIPTIGDGPPRPPEIIPLRALTAHVISIDPASSRESKAARTAISWFGLDRPTGRVFWLDCRGDRWSPDDAIDVSYAVWIDACAKLGYEPDILVEKVAAQSYVASALRFKHRLAVAEGGPSARWRLPEIEMIPPAHGVAKDDRIVRRFGWRLGQGLMYLRSGLQLPRSEVMHFPTGTKDALDTEVQAEERFLTLVRASTGGAGLEARRARRRRRIAGAGPAGAGLG